MFDYRSGDSSDWAGSKDAIERSIEFLTGGRIETNYAGNYEENE